MSIYAFEPGPKYRPLTPQAAWNSALSQPLGLGANLLEQTGAGVMQSFGLGTTIRDTLIPQGNVERSPLQIIDALTPGVGMAKEAVRGLVQNYINPDQPSLTEDEWKASPSYRENIPYDPGMTEARAQALAEWDDVRKVREHFASKRPFSSFVGNLAGQALDPINYVPVVSPLIRAAAVAKAGRVAGTAAIGSLDAAANTALAAGVTYSARGSYGDDVSWQGTISEIATAALIGGAFGTVAGAIGARSDARAVREATERLSTLKTTQEARIALNEAIDGIVSGDDIRLSPNATEPLARVADELPVGPIAVEPGVALANAGFDLKRLAADIGDVDGIMRAASVEDAARAVQVQEIASAKARLEELEALQPTSNSYGPGLRRTDKATPDEQVYDYGMSAMTEKERSATIAKEADRLAMLEKREAAGTVAPDIVETIKSARSGQPGAKLIPQDSSLNRTASWVIRDKATGKAVMETFDAKLVEKVNTAKYEAVPIGQYLGEINGQPKRGAAVIDTTPARPDPIPEGRAKAEAALAKAETYKATAEQYRVDPETGSYAEEAEINQLEIEGRLTEADKADLEAAAMIHENGVAYGDALKAAANCLL